MKKQRTRRGRKGELLHGNPRKRGREQTEVGYVDPPKKGNPILIEAVTRLRTGHLGNH